MIKVLETVNMDSAKDVWSLYIIYVITIIIFIIYFSRQYLSLSKKLIKKIKITMKIS